MLKHFTEALIALGPLGVLALAFIDSTGIPVAQGVDVLLLFLAVKSPKTAVISAVLAIAGSTVGNFLLFLAARKGGQAFLERSGEGSRTQRFKNWFIRYGLVTVFVPALVPFPMPLKLFVISAGVLGTTIPGFLAVVLVARILRYGGEVWLGLALGRDAVGFLKSHVWSFAAGAVLLFLALYFFVRLSDSARNARRSGTLMGPEDPDRVSDATIE